MGSLESISFLTLIRGRRGGGRGWQHVYHHNQRIEDPMEGKPPGEPHMNLWHHHLPSVAFQLISDTFSSSSGVLELPVLRWLLHGLLDDFLETSQALCHCCHRLLSGTLDLLQNQSECRQWVTLLHHPGLQQQHHGDHVRSMESMKGLFYEFNYNFFFRFYA